MDSLVPYRGHAGLVVPPTTFAGRNSLGTTYGFENGAYLISTVHSGLVLGPYWQAVLDTGLGTMSDIFFLEDDSVVVPKFRECMCSCLVSLLAVDGWTDLTTTTPRD